MLTETLVSVFSRSPCIYLLENVNDHSFHSYMFSYILFQFGPSFPSYCYHTFLSPKSIKSQVCNHTLIVSPGELLSHVRYAAFAVPVFNSDSFIGTIH